MKLYESVDIWKRTSSEELVRYRCLRSLITGKYVVQSSDFYTAPFKSTQEAYFQKQFLEFLADSPPDERSGGFASPAEAIDAHEQAFGGAGDAKDGNN